MVQRYIDELRLLQAITLAVVATDRDGAITFVNEAGAAAYRAQPEDLVGRDVRDLLGGAPAQGRRFDLDAVLAGETWAGDLTIWRPHGGSFLAAVSATPIRNAEDTVTGAVVVAEDMTEIREAEAEAAASEQRLRLAHEAARLGSWHWDMATGINVWDEQLEGIYGMPRGGFDGTFEAWEATLHPDDHDHVMQTVQEALEQRSPYVLRNRIVHPDGTLHWIEAHGKVTTDESGAPTGTIGCVRDITDEMRVREREAETAARAALLQRVTAELSRAWTPAQVTTVLEAGLKQVAEIVGTGVELRVPDDPRLAIRCDDLVQHADRPLSPEDVQLLDTLASQCAIAAERAHLLGRTTEIAEQLQSSLAASPLPEVDHLDVAAHYAPGGDDLEHVGGDWYDAVPTRSGGVALVVGDVMGRGVRAATTMIRVRAGIRGLLTVDPSPRAVLGAADEMMTRDAPDQFVTAAAALLDANAGTLTLCNAGHIPVVVVHPDGSTEALGGGSGVPLGVVREHERREVQAELEPGSLVVMVTDGVVESRNDDLDHGIEQLRRRAAQLRHLPLDRLVVELAEQADESLHDDVTVVAARVR
jgi:PAS domain S-box-containing protein